ncbi:MAG: hypothetical protein KBF88_00145 [Polyangiaceae bacterium]|nr:hypothetical protein [Polyangiaceae bacterium]
MNKMFAVLGSKIRSIATSKFAPLMMLGIVGASVVGVKAFASSDCCAQGAACCKPGAACCAGEGAKHAMNHGVK